MADIKRITLDWNETGITVYYIARREIDDFRMDDSDGDFASAPADPYQELTEDAVIKGRYEADESRVAWDDGRYTFTFYKQTGGSPAPASDTVIGTGEMHVRNDFEVVRDFSSRDVRGHLFSLIESQRGSHTGSIEIIYWDPIGGLDTGSGLAYSEAKKTFNFNGAGGIYSLLNNNDHQIIIGLPSASGGPTIVNEYTEVDKAYSFFRGPGRDWLFEATHNEACAILASAEGVELSGFRAKTKATGSQDAICMTGDFVKVRKVWVDFSRGSGVTIDNASSCILEDFLVQDAATGGSGHAVHILGDTSTTERNIIRSGRIIENNVQANTDGIRIDGSFCKHNFIEGSDPDGMIIHDNSGWGINEVNGADETIIVGPRVHLQHNTLGEHNLTGSASIAENAGQWAKDEDMQTVGRTLLQSTTIATLASQSEFTLSDGSSDDDAYNNALIIITDATTEEQKAVGLIGDYVGSTKAIILSADPAIFTMAVGDTVDIMGNSSISALVNAVISEKVDTLLDINKSQKMTVDTTTRLEYQWLDSDGDVVDISLLTFKFKAVKDAGETSPAIPEVTGTISDGPNGRWYFDILPTTVFKGRYEIWAVDGSSKITPLTKAGGARIETHPRL